MKTTQYISKALIDLISHGVEIDLTKEKKWNSFSMEDDGTKRISVKINDDISCWFPNFVHEYCHFLQWKEKKFQSNIWDIALISLDDCLSTNEFPDKKELKENVRRIKRIEIDCESRVIKQIKKYKLDINLEDYIRKANAYIFSYNFLIDDKAYLFEQGICRKKELWSLMPSHMLSRYDRTPKTFVSLAEEIYKEKNKK